MPSSGIPLMIESAEGPPNCSAACITSQKNEWMGAANEKDVVL